MVTLTLAILSVGLGLLSAWFGLRSMFQSQYLETLQSALRAYNQALFNSLWRIGDNADRALKADDLAGAQQSGERSCGHVPYGPKHAHRI